MRSKIAFVTIFCLLLSAVAFAAIKSMQVQVKDGVVRTEPSFLGKVVSTLSYGEKVGVVESKAPWIKVSSTNGGGWMHDSALTTKEIIFDTSSANVSSSASSDEIALAGKGFNKDVEEEYSRRNSKADFPAVDRMEAYPVDFDELLVFVKDGKLACVEVAQ